MVFLGYVKQKLKEVKEMEGTKFCVLPPMDTHAQDTLDDVLQDVEELIYKALYQLHREQCVTATATIREALAMLEKQGF